MTRLHRSTLIVLTLALLSCGVGTYFTHDVVQRSEHRLLQQKAAEGSLILASLMSQSYGAAGTAMAGALNRDGTLNEIAFGMLSAALQKPATGSDAGLGLTGIALVDLRTGRPLASSGTILADLADGRVQKAVKGRSELSATGLADRAGKLALGMAMPIGTTAAAYFETPLEGAVQEDDILPGQPFAGLDYAVYVGEATPSHLMWTNVASKRLDGEIAQAYVGLNLTDTYESPLFDPVHRPMLIQLEAQSPLMGRLATVMPWLLLAFGLIGSLLVVILLEASQRRRDAALVLVAELECRNGEVQAAVQQRVEVEERLRQSQRLEAVGQLAGGIAHDFNNLLAVIISYAGFLKPAVAGHPMAEDVEEIDKAAHRAAELTQQLLMFSRREPVRPSVVDARALVADRERLLRRTLSEDIELVVELPDHPVHVRADAIELDQVVMNLVVNARDAMPYGGRLHLVLTEIPSFDGGADVQLLVADNGSGMEPEVLEHALEPFFTTKEVGRGTGLGLATVYGIVTRWGGEVRLSSRVGEGTVVTVQLPRCEGPSGLPAVPKTTPQVVAPGTVLLVEDEDGVRRATQRILLEAGFDVIVAEDGLAALEAFDSHDIDVLVTDVVMPGGMSGPDLAEQCRDRRPGLPVVLASGHSRDHLSRRGSLPPATLVLRKPFTASELLAAVAASRADRAALA